MFAKIIVVSANPSVQPKNVETMVAVGLVEHAKDKMFAKMIGVFVSLIANINRVVTMVAVVRVAAVAKTKNA